MATQIAVLGAGSWGTALALALARNGHQVKLWSHRESQLMEMRLLLGNPAYLPGIVFPPELTPEGDLAALMAFADQVLIAVPSHAFGQICEQIKELIDADQGVAWATKGLAPDSHQLLHEQLHDLLGERDMAMISGPSFAKEVALQMPTALTVAASSAEFAGCWAELLHGETMRAYTSGDLIGVEVCGAVKNVLAIAAGISDGLGFGANARAALITRGLVEMQRLGAVLGAQPETFFGLAGLGDLLLTCTDNQSRNRRAGLGLARGLSREQVEAEVGQVVEGLRSVVEVRGVAAQQQIEMPITEQVYQIAHHGADPLEAVRLLLARQAKAE
ncbi:MAG: NAD(P)-dependent glycerol-3-phosphate dehydrogenase [Immundisolibacteraceae bacterium]|nr:NAD(P)-dependent glycerol-3-phosphate dehydrogenase [Immundisolibacteraceae bacterium]